MKQFKIALVILVVFALGCFCAASFGGEENEVILIEAPTNGDPVPADPGVPIENGCQTSCVSSACVSSACVQAPALVQSHRVHACTTSVHVERPAYVINATRRAACVTHRAAKRAACATHRAAARVHKRLACSAARVSKRMTCLGCE